MLFTMVTLSVFMTGYLLNIFYITVLYHRGLTHQAVQLSPGAMKFLERTGIWVTGIDPKAWACMHRMHHQYSDTEKDPHSPVHLGIFGVAHAQLKAYENTLRQLIRKQSQATQLVADIPFDVSLLNRKKLWMLPYLLHLAIGATLGLATGSWILGLAYYLGIMSHPIQGWMVNSLAHAYGYRNYSSPDNSRNNTLVSWLVFGEGLQNNHHQFPKRACFAIQKFEVDLGYGLCLAASRLGILSLPKRGRAKKSRDFVESLAPLGF